jgi:hypothetical protein
MRSLSPLLTFLAFHHQSREKSSWNFWPGWTRVIIRQLRPSCMDWLLRFSHDSLSNCRISQYTSPMRITALPAVVADVCTSTASSWMGSLLEVNRLKMTGLILLSTVQDVLLFPIKLPVGITRGLVPSRSEKFGVNLYLEGTRFESRRAPYIF